MPERVGSATMRLNAASAITGIRVNRFRLVTFVFLLSGAHILWQTPVRLLDFTTSPPSAVKRFYERMFASSTPFMVELYPAEVPYARHSPGGRPDFFSG